MSHIAPEFEIGNNGQDPVIVQEVLKMPPPTDVSGSAVLSSFGAISQINFLGTGTLRFQLLGTWVGTYVFEATLDGTNWFSVEVFKDSTKTYVTSASANDTFIFFVAAFKSFRIKNTAFTSGSTNFIWFYGIAIFSEKVARDSSGRPQIQIVGSDGLYKATVDSVGRVATNANVTFPEVIYIKTALLNGSSKACDVNGSVTPVSFRFTPSTYVFYLELLSLVIEDQGDFTPNLFGKLTALTNGVQINVKSKGQTFTISNLKDNADIYGTFIEDPAAQSFSALLQANQNTYWASWSLQNRIVLDPAQGDYLEVLIRDNLKGLDTLNFYATVWRVLG